MTNTSKIIFKSDADRETVETFDFIETAITNERKPKDVRPFLEEESIDPSEPGNTATNEKEYVQEVESKARQADSIQNEEGNRESGNSGESHSDSDTNEAVDIDALMKNAYEMGVNAGMEEMRRQMEPALFQMKTAIEDINQFGRHLLDRARAETAEVAIYLARQIVQDQLLVDPSKLLAAAKEEISKLRDSESLVIRVHPDIAESFEKHKDLLSEQRPSLSSVTIRQDESIEDGGCIIETDMEAVDLTPAARIDQLLKQE